MSNYDPNTPMNMPEAGPELDADVVCQECGMVNEPGTLMCKQCGNNLRDQKRVRLATGQEAIAPETTDRRKIISGVLSVVGIIIVIIVALNPDVIVEGFQSQDDSGTGRGGDVLWTGSRSAVFEEMAQSLREFPPTNADMQAALTSLAPENTLEGRYIIREEAATEASIIGIAEVRDTGSELLFVAMLEGDIEVRGIAEAESTDRATSPGAAVRGANLRKTGVGIAKRNAQEAFTIIGADNDTGQQVRYVAHAIPY